MQTPLRITFRHTEPSKALAQRVRELTTRLERFHSHITGCHVVIEGPAAHREYGGVFSVHVEVTIPGGAINAVSPSVKYRDAYVAAAVAFETAKQQLIEFATH